MATENLESDFKRLADSEQLVHGYIFFGADTARQLGFATSLASYLENKKWEISKRVLSDANFIDGAKVDLGVEVARSATHFLYRQPVASKYRTLVISAAEEFTTQAQNALLKIAEEPPSHGLIILILKDANVLLPALRSRFQHIFFPAKGGQGRQAEKQELTELEKEALNLVKEFLSVDRRGKSLLIKSLAEREREVEKSEKLIDTFTKFLIEELAKNPKKNSAALKELLKRYSAIKDLSTNKRLQLEAVIQYL